MKNKSKKLTVVASILLGVFIAFIGTTLIPLGVIGANNASTITRVNITNTEPTLYSVIITPDPIDLNPGNTTIVNCTGYVYDLNGWDDINQSNASLYHINYGDGTTFDNNYRYQNTSCNCTQFSGEPFNASCSCLFNVWYYSDNGTWRCNMTITDEFGISDTLESGDATINTVIGINAPDEIDYGNMSVTETSSEVLANVSNFGNTPINVSVRGYGGTDPSIDYGGQNYSMICSYGNISIEFEKYSVTSGIVFNNMINLSNVTTMIDNFGLPIRTDDNNYGNDTNATYWRIYIPATVSGECNGTIEFYAIDDSG